MLFSSLPPQESLPPGHSFPKFNFNFPRRRGEVSQRFRIFPSPSLRPRRSAEVNIRLKHVHFSLSNPSLRVIYPAFGRFNFENRFRFNSIPPAIPDCAPPPPPLSHRKSTLNSVFVGVERRVVREQ